MCQISDIYHQLTRYAADMYSTGSTSAADASSPGSPIAAYNPIQAFLRHHNPAENEEFGVRAEVMQTFLRSCAGYSVISYILGGFAANSLSLLFIQFYAL
jgi:phosphatidylinositol 3-kinase